MTTASRILRERTADEHDRLDAQVRTILSSGEAGCRRFLSASRRVVVPWEDELRRFPWPDDLQIARRLQKARWLDEDLAPAAAEEPLTAGAANEAEAWGALYVFEGSTLGASVIRTLPGCDGFRYLQGYGSETPAMWARMRAGMDQAVRTPAELDGCVLSAKRVFTQFAEALL
jgi:heme oxygenase (biliverdin-IX-beta and delta-forming)